MDWINVILTDELFAPIFSIFQFLWAPIGAGVAALVGALFWRKSSKRNRFRKVFHPRDPADFFRYFSKVIGEAKVIIRNSGDGFTLSNPESLKHANTLDQAFFEALEKGVEVRRFQIVSSAPISWYSRLATIKETFPDHFRLFINRNNDGIGSFCVIDPGTRNTVFEQQIVSGLIVGRGTEPVNFSFLHGNQTQSDRATELFDRAALGDGSQELTAEEIWAVQESEWDRRVKKAKADPSFVLADPEILDAMRVGDAVSLAYPRDKFRSEFYTKLDFSNNWHT